MGLFDILSSGEQSQPVAEGSPEHQQNTDSWRQALTEIQQSPDAMAALWQIGSSMQNRARNGEGFMQNLGNSVIDGGRAYSSLQAQRKDEKRKAFEQARADEAFKMGEENATLDRERQARLDKLNARNIESQIKKRESETTGTTVKDKFNDARQKNYDNIVKAARERQEAESLVNGSTWTPPSQQQMLDEADYVTRFNSGELGVRGYDDSDVAKGLNYINQTGAKTAAQAGAELQFRFPWLSERILKDILRVAADQGLLIKSTPTGTPSTEVEREADTVQAPPKLTAPEDLHLRLPQYKPKSQAKDTNATFKRLDRSTVNPSGKGREPLKPL